MYPPKPTQDVQELVTALTASLQRGGQNLGDVLPEVGKRGEEIYQVRLRLALPLPKSALVPIIDYIKQYIRESEWAAQRVVADKHYISFFVSRAPSRTSRKR